MIQGSKLYLLNCPITNDISGFVPYISYVNFSTRY